MAANKLQTLELSCVNNTIPQKKGGEGSGDNSRLLRHVKMLLVPIMFSFSLMGRLCFGRKTFSLIKCDFCRLFQTERS